MAAAPPAPPPAAPPSPPSPPPAAPTTPIPGSAPPSKGVIHVGAPTSTDPVSAPKKGSARDRMFQELRKKAKIDEPSTPPAAPTPPPSPTPPSEPPEPPEPPAEPGEPPAEPSTPPAAPAGEKKKVSPWKLVDEYKQRLAEAETKLAEATKGIPSEEERKASAELAQKRDARLKELEDEMRFVNYTKSQEFKDKFQKPYEEAWTRAMDELKEIMIVDPVSGAERPTTPNDLLDLVNMTSLGQAKAKARDMFGEFADDVMAHRKEIKKIFDAQNQAMEEIRTQGAEREQQRMTQARAQQEEVVKLVNETWTKANEAATADEKFGRFFKPADGDEEGNKRLTKGFELVDRGFQANAFDPNLTPEQRAAVVRTHAAIRNRAAAFGKLTHIISTLEQEIETLRQENEQFKGSTPPASGSTPASTTPVGHTSAKEEVFGALRKLAK